MAGPVLTQNLDGNPWVEVYQDPSGLAVGTATVRLSRYSEGRTWLVRGGVDIAPGVAAQDFEVPFGVPASYRAEMFDASGLSLGFTDATTTTVEVSDMWVHNPLEPVSGVNLGPHGVKAGSLGGVRRPTVGESVYVEGASVGRWVGSRRRGVVGGVLGLAAESPDVADELNALLGDYVTARIGVLCVRTPPPLRIPRTLFAGVQDPEDVDVNSAFGGSRVDVWFGFDEVAPPFPGLVKSLLSYDDLDAFYASYAAADVAYATYTERDRDYALAGFASSGS